MHCEAVWKQYMAQMEAMQSPFRFSATKIAEVLLRSELNLKGEKSSWKQNLAKQNRLHQLESAVQITIIHDSEFQSPKLSKAINFISASWFLAFGKVLDCQWPRIQVPQHSTPLISWQTCASASSFASFAQE